MSEQHIAVERVTLDEFQQRVRSERALKQAKPKCVRFTREYCERMLDDLIVRTVNYNHKRGSWKIVWQNHCTMQVFQVGQIAGSQYGIIVDLRTNRIEERWTPNYQPRTIEQRRANDRQIPLEIIRWPTGWTWWRVLWPVTTRWVGVPWLLRRPRPCWPRRPFPWIMQPTIAERGCGCPVICRALKLAIGFVWQA